RADEALAEMAQGSADALDPDVVGISEGLQRRQSGCARGEVFDVAEEFAHRTDGGAGVEENGLTLLHLGGGPFGDGAFGVEAFEYTAPQRRLRLAFQGYRAAVGPRDQSLRHQQAQVAANR